MKIMIIPNFDKKNTIACLERTCEILRELNIKILMDKVLQDVFFKDYIDYGEFYSQIDKASILIPIGGDGTIIHTAKHAVQKNKPILGINSGRVGFLAGLEPSELDNLKKLVGKNYKLQKRIMLEVTHKSGENEDRYLAFNDAVISKGALSRMIETDIYCNDRYVISYRADGLIFSTPIGSTAYNLSAGGPILEPNSENIIMTPICPQSLFNRSIVFSSDNILKIGLSPDNDADTFLNIDGENVIKLCQNDLIIIKRSNIEVNMISVIEKPFYEILNDKFIKRAK